MMDYNLERLQRELAEKEKNLRLIQERVNQFVLPTDVPLDLVKASRELEQQISKLKVSISQSETAEHEDKLFTDQESNVANPFEYGLPVPPERFYGRNQQRADIKNSIGGISAQCISIIGLRRNGKTSLLRYVQERVHEFCPMQTLPLVTYLDFQNASFHTPDGVIEGLRRSIEKVLGSSPWHQYENSNNFAVNS
jgi:hypothetical protein